VIDAHQPYKGCLFRRLDGVMRTTIVIDEDLMQKALAISGLKTKRDVVEEGLRLMIHLHEQAQIVELNDTLQWEGDLNALREDRIEYSG
jgi:Arc/MetJ family transcription regulator